VTDLPITHDWLLAHRWRVIREGPLDADRLYRRAIGDELASGREFVPARDDLCIDLSPPMVGGEDGYFVWVAKADPARHVFVRHFRTVGELTQLWSALTGRAWVETRWKA
jgi:hypothetical protein